jgi:hypothetical protein
MSPKKTALALAAMLVLSTCGGGGGGGSTPTGPNACSTPVAGTWRWELASCFGSAALGFSTVAAPVSGSCKITMDTTPSNLKAAGQTWTLNVDFAANTATLDLKGSLCDGTDRGVVSSRSNGSYQIDLTPSGTTANCCTRNYVMIIAKEQ